MVVQHLQEGSTVDVAGPSFTRLLVVVDGSDEGRRAVAFAEAWSRAVGSEVQLLELPREGLGGQSRSSVSAVVEAAGAFGADVIVLGCQKRRLAHHRLGLSLRERLARATDLPLLVPSPASGGHSKEKGTDMGSAPIGRVGSRSVAHV
jgi:nucleotide-binding universal stress UspA family protein